MGGVSAAAACATSPNRVLRLLALWLMTPRSAVHWSAGTSQRAAAAAISISRAVAPALRKKSCEVRIERLPPVDMSPNARLRRRFSSGGTNSARTWSQSQPSSSATSIGNAVNTPWPISERATRIVTRSSGAITIQAVISGVSIVRSGWASAEAAKPSVSAPPTAAVLTRKARRLTSGTACLVISRLAGCCDAR